MTDHMGTKQLSSRDIQRKTEESLVIKLPPTYSSLPLQEKSELRDKLCRRLVALAVAEGYEKTIADVNNIYEGNELVALQLKLSYRASGTDYNSLIYGPQLYVEDIIK